MTPSVSSDPLLSFSGKEASGKETLKQMFVNSFHLNCCCCCCHHLKLQCSLLAAGKMREEGNPLPSFGMFAALLYP
jgi:hypothetical protein